MMKSQNPLEINRSDVGLRHSIGSAYGYEAVLQCRNGDGIVCYDSRKHQGNRVQLIACTGDIQVVGGRRRKKDFLKVTVFPNFAEAEDYAITLNREYGLPVERLTSIPDEINAENYPTLIQKWDEKQRKSRIPWSPDVSTASGI